MESGRVNEIEINKNLQDMSDEAVKTLLRKRLPEPSKVRKPLKTLPIPKNISSIIDSLQLFDEHDHERRLNIFLGYCLYIKEYSYNTTLRYYNIMKRNGVFGDVVLKPNKHAFFDSGKRHTRVVSMVNFRKLITYLNENFSKFTLPLILAAYTGLRTMEILQFTTHTLYYLGKQKPTISNIKRKQTKPEAEINCWTPVYTNQLLLLVKHMSQLYREELKVFDNGNGVDVKLFNVTPRTLVNRIRTVYRNVIGEFPPNGFGIHSCRNMIAMMMAESSNDIYSVKDFLQHRKVRTTERYLKADFSFATSEFNRLTQHEFKEVRENLSS